MVDIFLPIRKKRMFLKQRLRLKKVMSTNTLLVVAIVALAVCFRLLFAFGGLTRFAASSSGVLRFVPKKWRMWLFGEVPTTKHPHVAK